MIVANQKTNVMRLLDGWKIPYTAYECDEAEGLSGLEIAAQMRYDCACMFKTLVTVGESRKHYVFIIPVAAELDPRRQRLPRQPRAERLEAAGRQR